MSDIRIIGLAWAVLVAHVEYPNVPAEILVAVAEHESDGRPDIVSWREGGVTYSMPFEKMEKWPHHAVCGYLQAMASTRDACRRMIDALGGMLAGAAEIATWLRTCRGELACALSGHAGGWEGVNAWHAGKSTPATVFARHMAKRAQIIADITKWGQK